MPYKDKEIQKIKLKEYRLKNRDKLIKYGREYRKTHHKILKEKKKKYNIENRDIINNKSKIYRINNPKKCRDIQLKLKYGISLDEYNALFLKQGGVCKICGKYQQHENLAVDHNHKTGKVRGLLCSSCNKGLGYFKDNPIILKEAIKYLR